MTRDEALQRLRALEPELRARGVGALYLFGSTARNESGAASDIDVLFEDAPGKILSLLDLAGLRRFLMERMGIAVDLADRKTLHFMLKDRIEADAIMVFS